MMIHLFPPNAACFGPLPVSIPRLRVLRITGQFAQAKQIRNYSIFRLRKLLSCAIAVLTCTAASALRQRSVAAPLTSASRQRSAAQRSLW